MAQFDFEMFVSVLVLARNTISVLFQACALEAWLWYISCTSHSSFSYSQCANNLRVKTSSLTGTTQRRHLSTWTWNQTQNLWDYCVNLKPQSGLIIYRPRILISKPGKIIFMAVSVVLYNRRDANNHFPRHIWVKCWYVPIISSLPDNLKLHWTFYRVQLRGCLKTH